MRLCSGQRSGSLIRSSSTYSSASAGNAVANVNSTAAIWFLNFSAIGFRPGPPPDSPRDLLRATIRAPKVCSLAGSIGVPLVYIRKDSGGDQARGEPKGPPHLLLDGGSRRVMT